MSRNHKKRKNVKVIVLSVILGVVLLILALLIVALLYFKYGIMGKSNYISVEHYTIAESVEPETYTDEDGEVHREEMATLDADLEAKLLKKQEEETAADVDTSGTYNLLVIGVDRRDTSWTGNSDVMMLVTINYDRQTIYMTSFLRDLYANIPGVGIRKLNAACALGGAGLCMDTIRSNYGVTIDNYAMVDFNSAAAIINALGGVDIEITEQERQVINAANGALLASAGMVHLNGAQAVTYARDRHSGNTYDFGRTQRQRNVLMAIFNKARSGGLGSLATAAASILPYVAHDIPDGKVLSLISELPDLVGYQTQQIHIPYDGEYSIQNEILIPNSISDTITKLRSTIY